MKQFSTARNTQRDPQSYIEKREEGDRGDQEEKRGSKKGRKQSSQKSNCYMPSTDWNTERDSQSYVEKRRERKEIEVT